MSGCGMSERPETSADIIAEMNRVEVCADGKPCLRDYADRLDAAHNREVDALKQRRAELNAEVAAKDEVIKRLNDAIAEEQRRKMAAPEKSSAVGNAAKLREAVIGTQSAIAKCMDILNKIPECGYNVLIDDAADELCDLREKHIKTALAAPARNCDVGTMEDQTRRYEDYCMAHTKVSGCTGCPLVGCRRCQIAWTQLPYEAKEGGAK